MGGWVSQKSNISCSKASYGKEIPSRGETRHTASPHPPHHVSPPQGSVGLLHSGDTWQPQIYTHKGKEAVDGEKKRSGQYLPLNSESVGPKIGGCCFKNIIKITLSFHMPGLSRHLFLFDPFKSDVLLIYEIIKVIKTTHSLKKAPLQLCNSQGSS